MKKPLTLFDHIANVTQNKVPWDKLSEIDKKSWNPFMVGRFLSMDLDLLELINYIEKYSIGVLSPEATYKLYLDVLPKRKFYLKYTKAMTEVNYDNKLVEILANYYKISKTEANQYLEIYFAVDSNLDDLIEILKKFGTPDKEVNKLLNLKPKKSK